MERTLSWFSCNFSLNGWFAALWRYFFLINRYFASYILRLLAIVDGYVNKKGYICNRFLSNGIISIDN